METKYLFTNWNEYHLLTQKLAAAIQSRSLKLDEIVAISRGGLTLGHLLSDLLQLPVSTFAIQSYTDIQTQGEVNITQHLDKSIVGKHILLVDDVSDSGKTFKRASAYIKSCKPARITTVSMYFKPQSIFRPDYFIKETNKWIIFPYEITETILYFTKKMTKGKKSKAEIQDFLTALGFHENQIKFVRKYHIA